jgi:hypothetical protein
MVAATGHSLRPFAPGLDRDRAADGDAALDDASSPRAARAAGPCRAGAEFRRPAVVLIRLTAEGERLLGEARPAFRDYAKGVEGRRLGAGRRERAAAPDGLRDAVNAELDARG